MRNFFRCSLFIFLLSCVDHNYVDNQFDSVLRQAELRCGSGHDMQWLRPILEKMESDPSFQGKLYAVTQDGETIFIHQPDILSCLACLLYDCDGNRLNTATAGIPTLTQSMSTANLIYTSPRK